MPPIYAKERVMVILQLYVDNTMVKDNTDYYRPETMLQNKFPIKHLGPLCKFHQSVKQDYQNQKRAGLFINQSKRLYF